MYAEAGATQYYSGKRKPLGAACFPPCQEAAKSRQRNDGKRESFCITPLPVRPALVKVDAGIKEPLNAVLAKRAPGEAVPLFADQGLSLLHSLRTEARVRPPRQ
jgi:hypothetical protein